MTNIIFDGTLIGKVIRVPKGISIIAGIITSFVIQLKEQIEGLPQEVPVYAKIRKDDYKLFLTACMSEGDIVQVNGKIYEEAIKFWEKDGIWMRAEHIYNESVGFGY
ncbi:MAG: hypothetical protein HWN67_04020 [Candidatus Helarchaeota archaeon]|nr:hypothetical protein [Candidatus Helarchaeota archaeon]